MDRVRIRYLDGRLNVIAAEYSVTVVPEKGDTIRLKGHLYSVVHRMFESQMSAVNVILGPVSKDVLALWDNFDPLEEKKA